MACCLDGGQKYFRITVQGAALMAIVTEQKSTRAQNIKLSANRKFRVGVLSLLLVLYPFLLIFGRAGVDRAAENTLFPLYNYAALTLAVMVHLMVKTPLPKSVFEVAAVLASMLLINYGVTDYASLKWLFNWFGFIFLSVVIASSIVSLGQIEFIMLQRYCSHLIKSILLIISAIMITTWSNEVDFLLENIFVKPNNVIHLLTVSFGLEKQALGVCFGIILSFGFFFWRTWGAATKLLLIATLILSLPALIGIRTLYLGLVLASAWYYLAKNPSIRYALFFASVPLITIAGHYLDELIDYFINSYDRFHSLNLSVSTLFSKPLGIGNGGYTQFIEDNEAWILPQFGSDLQLAQDAFWKAPESDLVYLFASWGILAVFFFAFYARLLWSGQTILRIRNLQPIERALIFVSWVMIFMGISQDNAGSIVWWVYMAAAYGVILRHRSVIRSRLAESRVTPL